MLSVVFRIKNKLTVGRKSPDYVPAEANLQIGEYAGNYKLSPPPIPRLQQLVPITFGKDAMEKRLQRDYGLMQLR